MAIVLYAQTAAPEWITHGGSLVTLARFTLERRAHEARERNKFTWGAPLQEPNNSAEVMRKALEEIDASCPTQLAAEIAKKSCRDLGPALSWMQGMANIGDIARAALTSPPPATAQGGAQPPAHD